MGYSPVGFAPRRRLARTKAWLAFRRRLLIAGRDDVGASAVEFALVLPLLLTLLLAIINFGVLLNNYVELTNSVRASARQLALSRGDTTPYTDTVTAADQAAPNLNKSKITLTVTVNGVTCKTDTACVTDFTNTQGDPAEVAGTYPCTIVIVNLHPNCTISAQSTERIE